MHKWALKQFCRIVPHGKLFTAHLAHRHLGQFAFSHGLDAPAPEPEPLRHCHCDECRDIPVAEKAHPFHVHVVIPGLLPEDKDGRLALRPQFERSVDKLVVSEQDPHFQSALQGLMGNLNAATLPLVVYSATRIHLKWHRADGHIECQDVFHSAEDYYDGAWHDCLLARHTVSRRGRARRMPTERSYRERKEQAAGLDIAEGEALDVARILGCHFCTVPDGARAGEVVPFFHIQWMHHFNCWRRIKVAVAGEEYACHMQAHCQQCS